MTRYLHKELEKMKKMILSLRAVSDKKTANGYKK